MQIRNDWWTCSWRCFAMFICLVAERFWNENCMETFSLKIEAEANAWIHTGFPVYLIDWWMMVNDDLTGWLTFIKLLGCMYTQSNRPGSEIIRMRMIRMQLDSDPTRFGWLNSAAGDPDPNSIQMVRIRKITPRNWIGWSESGSDPDPGPHAVQDYHSLSSSFFNQFGILIQILIVSVTGSGSIRLASNTHTYNHTWNPLWLAGCCCLCVWHCLYEQQEFLQNKCYKSTSILIINDILFVSCFMLHASCNVI